MAAATAALAGNTERSPAPVAGTARAPAIAAPVATAVRRWRGVLERNAWLLLEPFLPGATLFLLLVVLSYGYLRGGFGAVRQSAFAPDGGKWVATAAARRRWWHCPCASLLACRCVQITASALRRRAGEWLATVCGACR